MTPPAPAPQPAALPPAEPAPPTRTGGLPFAAWLALAAAGLLIVGAVVVSEIGSSDDPAPAAIAGGVTRVLIRFADASPAG